MALWLAVLHQLTGALLVAASAWGNLWNTRTRGASTLTMQLAGLIDDGLARPAEGRSAVQKLGQAITATAISTNVLDLRAPGSTPAIVDEALGVGDVEFRQKCGEYVFRHVQRGGSTPWQKQ